LTSGPPCSERPPTHWRATAKGHLHEGFRPDLKAIAQRRVTRRILTAIITLAMLKPMDGTPDIISTTTPSIDGTRIVRYLGIVSGEAILGANIFRDMFAGIRDIVGGRAGAYEQQLRQAKSIAIEEMVEQARERGANAIVSVDLDYETIQTGESGGMLMVTASGTAVQYERSS
jgi:uncharacterized protein YbjQ (UPF0145 family)